MTKSNTEEETGKDVPEIPPIPSTNDRRLADRERPPASDLITRREVEDMHYENVRSIEQLKKALLLVEDSNQTILEWTNNAKLASQVMLKTFNIIGRFFQQFTKILGALAALYALYLALKQGKMPSFFEH